MPSFESILSLPDQIEQWLLLAYVGMVLAGARVLEVLGRAYVARARRLYPDSIDDDRQAVAGRAYRSLAAISETDFGRFHGHLALVMLAAACVLVLASLLKWGGQRGTGLLVFLLLVSAHQLITGVRRAWHRRSFADRLE